MRKGCFDELKDRLQALKDDGREIQSGNFIDDWERITQDAASLLRQKQARERDQCELLGEVEG